MAKLGLDQDVAADGRTLNPGRLRVHSPSRSNSGIRFPASAPSRGMGIASKLRNKLGSAMKIL